MSSNPPWSPTHQSSTQRGQHRYAFSHIHRDEEGVWGGGGVGTGGERERGRQTDRLAEGGGGEMGIEREREREFKCRRS